jgi:hypothetical protein
VRAQAEALLSLEQRIERARAQRFLGLDPAKVAAAKQTGKPAGGSLLETLPRRAEDTLAPTYHVETLRAC